jgi:hypothetical protein
MVKLTGLELGFVGHDCGKGDVLTGRGMCYGVREKDEE